MGTEQEESPLSEEEQRAIRSRLLDRGIFKLYEIGEKMDAHPANDRSLVRSLGLFEIFASHYP